MRADTDIMTLPTGPVLVTPGSAHPPKATAGKPIAEVPSLERLLGEATSLSASDVHLRVGAPPLARIDGSLTPLGYRDLQAADTSRLVEEALHDSGRSEDYRTHLDVDLALDFPTIGRFRANAYRASGSDAMVLRHIRADIPDVTALGIPKAVLELTRAEQGLILVCGPTGSGKSTTLASLIDQINRSRTCHILTIEDPVEFIHTNIRASVSQREVETDTPTYARALKSGLRQDPDVILIGEIRDGDTMRIALQAAETGHLVLASLHAKSSIDAINRVLDFFTSDEQRQLRATFANVLQGVISQRLLSDRSGRGRVLAREVLIGTDRVRQAILDSQKTPDLPEIVAESEYYGMCTLDQDLVRLVIEGAVTADVAYAVAHKPSDVRVALKRVGFVEAQ